MQACWPATDRQAFRTDAKCERGRIVLGGWSLERGLNTKEAQWFILDITPQDVPALFKDDLSSEWASTSAELLGSYAGLIAFGHASPTGGRDRLKLQICAGTDNKSTPAITARGLSNKWPVQGTHMQLATTMRRANKLCKLDWRPRSLASLTSVQLADALVVLSLARGADPEAGVHSATAIKAIRWVRRNPEVHCLEISYSPLISSFLKSKIPRERKEAVPLSLYVVMHFERRILMQDCTDSEVLLLGSFLILIWASLRFMDGQRVHLRSLSFDGSTLRGSCYQTKTTSHGQPFGLMCQGFLSHGSFTWTYKFLGCCYREPYYIAPGIASSLELASGSWV